MFWMFPGSPLGSREHPGEDGGPIPDLVKWFGFRVDGHFNARSPSYTLELMWYQLGDCALTV